MENKLVVIGQDLDVEKQNFTHIISMEANSEEEMTEQIKQLQEINNEVHHWYNKVFLPLCEQKCKNNKKAKKQHFERVRTVLRERVLRKKTLYHNHSYNQASCLGDVLLLKHTPVYSQAEQLQILSLYLPTLEDKEAEMKQFVLGAFFQDDENNDK